MKRSILGICLLLTIFLTSCRYTDFLHEFIRENAVSGNGISGSSITGASVTGAATTGQAVESTKAAIDGKGESDFSASQGAVRTDIVSGSGVSVSEDVDARMLTAEYWIGKTYAKDQILQDHKKIQSANQNRMDALHEDTDSGYADFYSSESEMTGSRLHVLMAREFLLKGTYYQDKRAVSQSDIKAYIENCAIDRLSDFNSIRFAVICEQTDVRELPTKDRLSVSVDDSSDLLWTTTISVNEPVLVLATSRDEKWFFIMSDRTAGWVPVSTLAFCRDKEEWNSYQTISDFLIVTGQRAVIGGEQWEFPLSKETVLQMGTRLPLASEKEIAGAQKSYGSRTPVWNNYWIRYPVRREDGSLSYEILPVPMDENVHCGYLELTRSQILQQAMRWQGHFMGQGENAAGTMVGCIMDCFGVRMPVKNSAWQKLASTDKDLVKDVPDASNVSVTNQLVPGMIALYDQAPAIYLGVDSQKKYVLCIQNHIVVVKTLK